MSALDSVSIEEARELWQFLTPEERREVTLILERNADRWMPLPGPQSEAFYSEADIVGFGGSAGGGKTDLACGLALTQHQRSIIYRREGAQLRAVEDRFAELIGSRAGLNGQAGIWRLPNRQIEFGGFPNLGDEKKYQGRPHDLKVFDEVTEMLELQVRFLMGWLRSSKKVRQRVLMTFNPPTTPEGRWIIPFFGPWLDKRHPNRAAPGELRWFTTIGGKDQEVPDSRPFVLVRGERAYDFDPADFRQDEVITPMSRTFIPSRVTDNPFYMASGYMSRLQALPEPLRSQMLYGDFEAGMEDDAAQVIPTDWVRQSMDRWSRKVADPSFRKPIMDSMGVDAAMGGRDKFVIARRHGVWFDDLLRFPGKQVPDGQTGAALVVQYRRDRAPVHVDVVGWGASTLNMLQSNDVQTIAINGANTAYERSIEGNLKFRNLRAELIWRMREALNPDGRDPIDLPDDAQLEADLTAYRWKYTPSGIQIESKDEMKKRLGRSPDDGDACCYALVSTPRNVEVIDTIQQLVDDGGVGGDWDRLSL